MSDDEPTAVGVSLPQLQTRPSLVARLRGLRADPPRRVTAVLSWLGLTVVGLLVAVLVFVAVAPATLGWHFVIVAGGSMEPAIPYGSLMVVEDNDPSQPLRPGDIIEFTSPSSGLPVTHRIREITADGRLLTTQGDANNIPDTALVPVENVHARYLFAIPHAGTIARHLNSRAGYLAMVLVPGLLIISGEVKSIVANVRKRKQQPPAEVEPSATA